MTETALIWRKSTFSGSNSECVEVAWRKSTASGSNSTCVEVGAPLYSAGHILVRNSNRPGAGTLAFTPAEFGDWLAGFRAGRFDDLT